MILSTKKHHREVMLFCWLGKLYPFAHIALQCGKVNPFLNWHSRQATGKLARNGFGSAFRIPQKNLPVLPDGRHPQFPDQYKLLEANSLKPLSVTLLLRQLISVVILQGIDNAVPRLLGSASLKKPLTLAGTEKIQFFRHKG